MSKKSNINSDDASRQRGSAIPVCDDVPFDGDQQPQRVERVPYIDISEIDDSEDGNPRKITKKELERLKKSLLNDPEFFEARPVLLNRVDGVLKIIGGHQRLKAAKEVGLTRVPRFIFEGLDDEKARHYNMLDNDFNGVWDFDKLKEFSVNMDMDNYSVSIPETIDYERIVAGDVLRAIVYKPSEKAANVSEFLDDELYDRVADKVLAMDIPDELREFVQIRLANFHRIRFDKVADYYARADEPTKALFRQLALVFDVSGTTFEQDILDFYSVGLNPDAYEG